MLKERKLSKEYEAQALAIAMVILVVSSLIGMSIYSRTAKDKGLVFEERASAEALEVTDVIMNKLTEHPVSTIIEKIKESQGLEEFDYVQGITLEENNDMESDITSLFQKLGTIEEGITISDFIAPLCPISESSNEYQVTLKEADSDTYYEIKPGHVWSLSVENLIKQDACMINMRLAVRGDTRAGFVLTKSYCNYDDITGDVIACKDYEYDDMLNYCFSGYGDTCNNVNFLDQDNWILYNPDATDGTEIIDIEIPRPEPVVIIEDRTFGTGADGACTVSANTDINIGSCVGRGVGDAVNFSVTNNVSAGAASVTLSSTPTGLAIGDEILIINLQGSTSSSSDVGEHDTAYITEIIGNTLTLDRGLVNGYDGTTQKIMVQRIPQYTSVTVNSLVNWYPSSWDGTKGGVLAFRATGTVTVTGTIHANGAGYLKGAAGTRLNYKGGGGGEAFCGVNNIAGGVGGDGVAASVTPGAGACGGGGGAGNDDSTTAAGGLGSVNLGGAGGGGGSNEDATSAGYNRAGGGGGGGYGTFGYKGESVNTGSDGVDGGTITSGNGGKGTTISSTNHTAGGGGGGGTYGDADLSRLFFGASGGGGGQGEYYGHGGAGGDGGGIVFISANSIVVSGGITSNGDNGSNGTGGNYDDGGGGGGGAGGSIKLIGDIVNVGTSKVTALGGAGGAAGETTGGTNKGGNGGNGRIAIKYVTSVLGTTNPVANISQFTLPEPIPIVEEEDGFQLSEIRIKAVAGTIGVSYSLPDDCANGLRMYQLRVTANCSGVYRGKEVLIPEAKWHNTIFDYILFNGRGSI